MTPEQWRSLDRVLGWMGYGLGYSTDDTEPQRRGPALQSATAHGPSDVGAMAATGRTAELRDNVRTTWQALQAVNGILRSKTETARAQAVDRLPRVVEESATRAADLHKRAAGGVRSVRDLGSAWRRAWEPDRRLGAAADTVLGLIDRLQSTTADTATGIGSHLRRATDVTRWTTADPEKTATESDGSESRLFGQITPTNRRQTDAVIYLDASSPPLDTAEDAPTEPLTYIDEALSELVSSPVDAAPQDGADLSAAPVDMDGADLSAAPDDADDADDADEEATTDGDGDSLGLAESVPAESVPEEPLPTVVDRALAPFMDKGLATPGSRWLVSSPETGSNAAERLSEARTPTTDPLDGEPGHEPVPPIRPVDTERDHDVDTAPQNDADRPAAVVYVDVDDPHRDSLGLAERAPGKPLPSEVSRALVPFVDIDVGTPGSRWLVSSPETPSSEPETGTDAPSPVTGLVDGETGRDPAGHVSETPQENVPTSPAEEAPADLGIVSEAADTGIVSEAMEVVRQIDEAMSKSAVVGEQTPEKSMTAAITEDQPPVAAEHEPAIETVTTQGTGDERSRTDETDSWRDRLTGVLRLGPTSSAPLSILTPREEPVYDEPAETDPPIEEPDAPEVLDRLERLLAQDTPPDTTDET